MDEWLHKVMLHYVTLVVNLQLTSYISMPFIFNMLSSIHAAQVLRGSANITGRSPMMLFYILKENTSGDI